MTASAISDDESGDVLVRQLIDRQAESRSLDYKGPIGFGPHKLEKAEILKDLMAFANSRDGGYILIGAEEKGGKFELAEVSDDQAATFDPTEIGNFARNYCSVLPRITSRTIKVDGVQIVLLRIAEFEDEPIVCTKDFHDGKKQILRAGSIYVRSADARCAAIDSGEAMRGLLDLAVQKRGDSLLTQIRGLVGVLPVVEPSTPPEQYSAELESSHQLFDEEDLKPPYWYVDIFPAEYYPDRIETVARLKEIRREAAVAIRGWDFPHVDREKDEIFESGIQSATHWTRYHEAHRIYKSGLFAWRRRLAEDSSEQYEGAISYVSSIYSITEFLIFVSRFTSLTMESGSVNVRIGLVGLKNRVLRSDPGIFFEDFSTGAESFERSYLLPLEELRASHMQVANKTARQLFDLYGLDVSEEVISGWQTKFIERRF